MSSQKVISGAVIRLFEMWAARAKLSARNALRALQISQTRWKETQRLTLLELAAFLHDLGNTRAVTDAMYVRNLDKLVEHVQLADKDLILHGTISS